MLLTAASRSSAWVILFWLWQKTLKPVCKSLWPPPRVCQQKPIEAAINTYRYQLNKRTFGSAALLKISALWKRIHASSPVSQPGRVGGKQTPFSGMPKKKIDEDKMWLQILNTRMHCDYKAYKNWFSCFGSVGDLDNRPQCFPIKNTNTTVGILGPKSSDSENKNRLSETNYAKLIIAFFFKWCYSFVIRIWLGKRGNKMQQTLFSGPNSHDIYLTKKQTNQTSLKDKKRITRWCQV